MRLTTVGAMYLTFVCLMPEFLIAKYPIPFYLGGTSILIVVVVAMDTVTQVQTRLMSSQYESLIKKLNLVNSLINEYSYLGPPGVGMGPVKFNCKKFNLHQLSTGELLRNEIKNKSKLGNQIASIINSGNLVSDSMWET